MTPTTWTNPIDTRPANTGSRLSRALILIPPCITASLLLIATPNGLGLSADSAYYLGVADEFAAGNGLRVPWGTMDPTPLETRWAPLLPALVGALSQALNLPTLSVFHALNIVCIAASILLIGVLMRLAGASAPWAFITQLLVATSKTFLEIHAMAWSEPLFILLSLATLSFLAAHQVRKRWLLFLCAAIALVLSFLTRYAGGALILTLAIALISSTTSWKKRIAALAAIFALLLLPMTPGGPSWLRWTLNHLVLIRTPADAANTPPLQLLDFPGGLAILGNALIPGILKSVAIPNAILLSIGSVAFLFLLAAAFHDRPNRQSASVDAPALWNFRLRKIFGIYILGYIAFCCAAVFLFARTTTFNERILLPLFPPALLIASLALARLSERYAPRALPALLTLLILPVLLSNAPVAALHTFTLAQCGGIGAQDYHSPKWRASPTLAALAALPIHQPILSNAPDAIYLNTGRRALWLPSRSRGAYQSPVPDSQDPNHMSIRDASRLLENGACIAYFHAMAWRPSSPTRAQLESALHLHVRAKLPDGIIYARPQSPESALAPDRLSPSMNAASTHLAQSASEPTP